MMQEEHPDDASSFRAFYQVCEQQGLLSRPPSLMPEDVCDGLTDEATLLRFFEGRERNADAARRQFQESVDVRQAMSAIDIYENIDIREYEATRALYPHWTGSRNTRGLPICMFDIGHLNNEVIASYKNDRDKAVSSNTKNELSAAQKAFAIHDGLIRFILPLCSSVRDRPEPDSPILSAVYLVDVSAFSLKQAWDLRTYAQDISKLLALSYPEVVDTVFVLNAPYYFGRIWSILKKWVDPRTATKLVIVPRSDVLPTLTTSIDIACIPEQFGGLLPFSHGSLPRVDSTIQRILQWLPGSTNELPAGPIKWVSEKEGRRKAVAVGQDHGHKRNLELALLNP